MIVTDPIADLLTRIRNALMAKHSTVDIPFSTTKLEITKIIKSEGYIKGYKVLETEGKKSVRIHLKYDSSNNSIINGLKKISKPGRRVYVKKDNIPKVLGGLGIAVLSTSKGIMTDKSSIRSHVGGELLCYIW